MGADQLFGTKGFCPGGMLHPSQDRIILWAQKIKRNVEGWGQTQNSISCWSSD